MVIDQWVIAFAAKKEAFIQDNYEIKHKGIFKHRLLGLKKGSKMQVFITGLNGGNTESMEISVSDEGTLNFQAKAPCSVELSYF